MLPEELLVEASVVALTLVPVWWVTTQATKPFVSASLKPAVDVGLSGFVFHLVCGEMGLNTWYLSNSVAYRKLYEGNKRWSTPSYGYAMESY